VSSKSSMGVLKSMGEGRIFGHAAGKGLTGPRSAATPALLQEEREGASRRALGEREGAPRWHDLSNASTGRRRR
jgi:hypothetical protein